MKTKQSLYSHSQTIIYWFGGMECGIETVTCITILALHPTLRQEMSCCKLYFWLIFTFFSPLGTRKHEETSWSSFNSIFTYFASKPRKWCLVLVIFLPLPFSHVLGTHVAWLYTHYHGNLHVLKRRYDNLILSRGGREREEGEKGGRRRRRREEGEKGGRRRRRLFSKPAPQVLFLCRVEESQVSQEKSHACTRHMHENKKKPSIYYWVDIQSTLINDHLFSNNFL